MRVKVVQKAVNGALVPVMGDSAKFPRPWAGETLVWEGEASGPDEALRKAQQHLEKSG